MDFKICATYWPHNRVWALYNKRYQLEVIMDKTGQNTIFGIDRKQVLYAHTTELVLISWSADNLGLVFVQKQSE